MGFWHGLPLYPSIGRALHSPLTVVIPPSEHGSAVRMVRGAASHPLFTRTVGPILVPKELERDVLGCILLGVIFIATALTAEALLAWRIGWLSMPTRQTPLGGLRRSDLLDLDALCFFLVLDEGMQLAKRPRIQPLLAEQVFMAVPGFGEHVAALATSAIERVIGRPQELLDGFMEQLSLLVVDIEFGRNRPAQLHRPRWICN